MLIVMDLYNIAFCLTRALFCSIIIVALNAVEISGVSLTRTETEEAVSLGFFILVARTTVGTCSAWL